MNIWSDVQYCTGFKSAHPGTVQRQRVAQPLCSYLCLSVMYLSLGTKIIDSFPKNKSLFSKNNNSSILLSCKAIKHQFWSPVASRVWRKTTNNPSARDSVALGSSECGMETSASLSGKTGQWYRYFHLCIRKVVSERTFSHIHDFSLFSFPPPTLILLV